MSGTFTYKNTWNIMRSKGMQRILFWLMPTFWPMPKCYAPIPPIQPIPKFWLKSLFLTHTKILWTHPSHANFDLLFFFGFFWHTPPMPSMPKFDPCHPRHPHYLTDYLRNSYTWHQFNRYVWHCVIWNSNFSK